MYVCTESHGLYVQLAETLYDAGYEYMLMPDHGPTHPDDPGTFLTLFTVRLFPQPTEQ